MMASALKSRGYEQPDPGTVVNLLQPDHGCALFTRFCDATAHWVERMYFSPSRPLSLHYRVLLPNGMEQTVLAQWLGAEAIAFAKAEARRLQKPRRGQVCTQATTILQGETASGLVLRRPGFDGRLPGLRMLHDRQAARNFVLPDDQAIANLGVTLRAHRLGKRAVLQFDFFDAEPKQIFVKLRPVTNTSGRRAYDRHVALFERLRGAVKLPRPLGFDPDYGASSFSALRGVPPTFKGSQPALIARALRRLQQVTDLPVESHTIADELAILRAWCDRVHEVFPDRTDRFAEAFSLVRDDLHRLPDMPSVPCHRDFHEGQILVDGNNIGLLDFDTLRLSDPALDAGNLIAHLRLAGLRTGQTRVAAEAAIIAAMEPIPTDRILTWARAAVLRLAAIYTFTSERRATLRGLLEDVIWPRADPHVLAKPQSSSD